jgi:hypothetical protein
MMRKVLLSIFILFSISAFAQETTQGNFPGAYRYKNRLYIDSLLLLPNHNSSTPIPLRDGAVRYNPSIGFAQLWKGGVWSNISAPSSLQDVTTVGDTTDNVISYTGFNNFQNVTGLTIGRGLIYSGGIFGGTFEDLQMQMGNFSVLGHGAIQLNATTNFGISSGGGGTTTIAGDHLIFNTGGGGAVPADFNSRVSGNSAIFSNEFITKNQSDSLADALQDSLNARPDTMTNRYVRNQKSAKQDASQWTKGVTADTFTYKGSSAPDVYSRRSSGVVGIPGASVSWYPSSGTMSYTWWTDPTFWDMALRRGAFGIGLWIGDDTTTNSALKVKAQGATGVNNVITAKDTAGVRFLYNLMLQDNTPRFSFGDSIPPGTYSFWINGGVGIKKDSVPNELTAVMPVITIDTTTGQLKKRYISITASITSLNGLTTASQTFTTGTSGSDFNISSTGSVHTFNIPDAGATSRGLVTTGAQVIAGQKTLSDSVAFLNAVVINLLKNVQVLGTDANGKLVNKTTNRPFIIGDSTGTSWASGDSLFIVSNTFNPAYASNGHGFTLADIFRRNANGFAYAGFDCRSIYGGTADYNHLAPFQDATRYRSTGTLGNYYSFVSVPTIDSGIATNRVAMAIKEVVVNSPGALVNNNGLVIDWLGNGSGSHWGILSQAPVKFVGNINKTNCTISDTGHIGEMIPGTWWQPTSTTSVYILPAANVNSEVGIGYFRSNGGSSGYKRAVAVRATNASTQTPFLMLMPNGGQVVINDSSAYTGGFSLVVKGRTYHTDTTTFFAQTPLAKFYVNSASTRFDLGSDAKWDTWYRDSTTNNFTRLAAGTIGQVMTAGNGGKPQWATPSATPTLQQVTISPNGNNTNQLIQIKGLAGNVLPGYALEMFMDSVSTPKTGNINAINRPSGVPIELRLNYLSGTYASPATIRLGGAGNDITVVGGNAIDSGHTNLITSGSHSFAITTITNSTILDNTYFTVLGNNSSNITVTLPTASSCTGRIYHIKKISNNANTITVNAATGINIDGSASITITSFNESKTIQSSGTAWFIL